MMNSHNKNTKILISTLNFVKIIPSVLIHMAKMTADASLHHQHITSKGQLLLTCTCTMTVIPLISTPPLLFRGRRLLSSPSL